MHNAETQSHMLRRLQIPLAVVVPVDITHLAPLVPQLLRQNMPLLTPMEAVALADIFHQQPPV